MEKEIEHLKRLYAEASKHSGYQILAEKLTTILSNEEIEVKSRYEKERLSFILQNVDVKGKNILDIGGNTGYFSFELLGRGAHKVHYIEGNTSHARFVKFSADILNLQQRIDVTNEYYTFSNIRQNKKYDIILLLNVLHHIGDDFGDPALSMGIAKKMMLEHINNLAYFTDTLILQNGFCWKGDRKLLLFENGTKAEIIEFTKNGVNENWNIVEIGIPELVGGEISYRKPNSRNLKRDDNLGEFLNRPLFILKSKK